MPLGVSASTNHRGCLPVVFHHLSAAHSNLGSQAGRLLFEDEETQEALSSFTESVSPGDSILTVLFLILCAGQELQSTS